MKNAVTLVAMLLLVCGTLVSAEQVYRWKDASGKWHFSDVPPDGVGAEPVKFSNMSVVKMPRPAPAASEAVAGQPPECAPGYSGDAECTEGLRRGTEAAVDDSDVAAPESPENRRQSHQREDSLQNRSQQIEGYNKSERVEQIDERNEAAKNYERGTPPTLNEKLRAKAGLE
ncbi:hypothetical protein GCM10011348_38030 [Marinobacterium nitratireducens]|uniref:DUF4124 domain-containing protein n=1 Tax=Marinobacterium nitratireducens TaxID=518897 RepID=A0A917ZN90_9GAMM|nr:DUF4124 domain-containing protein [Marinobacterium nitratireducens]GGO86671.1 hypothetical protein GCM10011348_38030 [Marinobacterium nitratireducens]